MPTLSHAQIEMLADCFCDMQIPEDGDDFERLVDSITDGVCAKLGIK